MSNFLFFIWKKNIIFCLVNYFLKLKGVSMFLVKNLCFI
jgi:hypothetical protein